MGGKIEEGIEGIRVELNKLTSFLRYIGIVVIIMAIVDIIDNILSWG